MTPEPSEHSHKGYCERCNTITDALREAQAENERLKYQITLMFRLRV